MGNSGFLPLFFLQEGDSLQGWGIWRLSRDPRALYPRSVSSQNFGWELLQAPSRALTVLTGPGFASTRRQIHLDFPLLMEAQTVPEGPPTSC